MGKPRELKIKKKPVILQTKDLQDRILAYKIGGKKMEDQTDRSAKSTRTAKPTVSEASFSKKNDFDSDSQFENSGMCLFYF
jgi:hypothetical protein